MAAMQDFIANLRELLVAMIRQARNLRLSQTASSLTLLTLLAVVPMAALGLSVLTALPAFENMRVDLEAFLASHLFLPSFSATVTRSINRFVASVDKLSAIGTLAFFATALSSMLTIDRTLNDIWRTPQPRPLWQRLAFYWTLLTVGPVLIGAAIGLQVSLASRLKGAKTVTDSLAMILPWLISAAVVTVLYRVAPNDRVRWRHAFAGAVLTLVLLELLRRGISLYITQFPTYTLVYGAFAALPVFLIWLFAVWLSVLLGALLAANLRHWGVAFGDPFARRPADEFERALSIVADIASAAPTPVPSARFAPLFDGDAREADHVAGALAMAGYLVRVWPVGARPDRAGVWDEVWLAGRDLGNKTLRPVFEAAWHRHALGARRLPSTPAVGGSVAAGPAGDPGSGRLDVPIAELFMKPR
jgi:membrane protein